MAAHHSTKVEALTSTWTTPQPGISPGCTAFLAFSTETDLSLPSIYVPHLGEESYNNMWQKSRSIWKYIYKFYRNEFDWFLLGGDDMYYIMENLYAYLESPEIIEERNKGQGVYLGRKLQYPSLYHPFPFNSGGSGYLLDQIALEKLATHLDTEACHPRIHQSQEDVLVALCLQSLSLEPFDTRDSFGRLRFHILSPGFSYRYRPSYHHNNLSSPSLDQDWYAVFDSLIQIGMNCCSIDSIAFHLIYPDIHIMHDIHRFIYHCPSKKKEEYYQLKGKEYFDRYLQ
eukprot:CAMPEP_0170074866 /NCGR_PEP_ID=MMETSP0019_2-20121128/12111_1 /TAXON_ID=98059 /ORGANISM="Dinobryon sp., Strain UTEXLB2267" /LENGTH=284 /DNA_ID=CAMNT_0010285479 /DNA_START=836 /DNA_END=1687 /DNA_ORIENTATION=-